MYVIWEIIKNILIRNPLVKKIAKRRHVTGVNQSPEGIQLIFDTYKRFTGFEGKDVLELGPGQTYGVACRIKDSGAKTVSIADIEKYIPDEILKKYEYLNYIIYDGNKIPVEDLKYDLVLSYTVYEHLRNPDLTVKETFRVLKDGGLVIHLIDLGDHMFYGKNMNSRLFNCLRFSDKIWNMISYNRSIYVNRLRQSEWIKLHEKAGFRILKTELVHNDYIRNLFEKGKLQYLKKITPEDRYVSSILLAAVK